MSNLSLSAFLDEFLQAVLEMHGEKVLSIVLFGSAARGDWKQGSSDLDLFVLLKEGYSREDLRDVFKLFSELNKKHDLRLDWSLRDPVIRRLHPPPLILEFEDIDWSKLRFKDPLVDFVVRFFMSKLFFQRLKEEGRVLYGEDILRWIEVKPGVLDRAKSWLFTCFLALYKRVSRFAYRS